MNNTPIIILNRDRLTPLKQLVAILKQKKYENLVIIDNQSTYIPLLDWYRKSGIKIFYNTILPNDINVLHRLVTEIKDPFFIELTKKHYVFTDSDTVPVDEIPDNFISDMIEYCDKYNTVKIGLGCYLVDVNLSIPMVKYAYDYEVTYWTNGIQEEKAMLYPHPIDTTFALYAPGAGAGWSANTYRMGIPYVMRHMPFYYFGDNMPEDEKYYLEHMDVRSGACFSKKVKESLNI